MESARGAVALGQAVPADHARVLLDQNEELTDEAESLRAELAERVAEHTAASRISSAMAEAVGWRTPGETWVDKAAYLRPLASELMGKRELREGIKPEGGFRPDWAVHPGEMLEEELDERGMTQTELAGAVGHSLKHVNQVCRGHVSVTAAFALRLERVLGASAEMWLRLQMAYDLHHARSADRGTP
jgi:addiction module HigA family antidote